LKLLCTAANPMVTRGFAEWFSLLFSLTLRIFAPPLYFVSVTPALSVSGLWVSRGALFPSKPPAVPLLIRFFVVFFPFPLLVSSFVRFFNISNLYLTHPAQKASCGHPLVVKPSGVSFTCHVGSFVRLFWSSQFLFFFRPPCACNRQGFPDFFSRPGLLPQPFFGTSVFCPAPPPLLSLVHFSTHRLFFSRLSFSPAQALLTLRASPSLAFSALTTTILPSEHTLLSPSPHFNSL